MKLHVDDEVLRYLITEVVTTVIHEYDAANSQLGQRMAFPEAEAAGLLGIPRHVLRDARLRGEIEGSRIGKRVVYSRDQLLMFLQKTRTK